MSRPVRLLLLILVLAALAPACKESRAPSPARTAPPTAAAPAPAPRLPDPFQFDDGTRVKTAAQWEQRRVQIQALLQETQYGKAPAAPPEVPYKELSRERLFDRQVVRRRLRLNLGAGASLQLGLTAPAEGGPYPAIVHIGHRPALFSCAIPREVAARGYILAEFTPTELCPDRPNVRGAIQKAHPTATWGTIACWAWGASRALDLLTQLKQVDPTRVTVVGHSRSGKAALWAGALDRRFALTVPMGSGCGGAGSYVIRGPGCERLADVTRNFPHWFRPGLDRYAGAEQRLPFDQHFVFALVAPRALLSVDAEGDQWANLYGTGGTHLGARPLYQFLGSGEKLGISFRPGAHELADRDWRTMMDFADRLFGRDPQPGSAGRTFDRLIRPVSPPPFSWKRPGE